MTYPKDATHIEILNGLPCKAGVMTCVDGISMASVECIYRFKNNHWHHAAAAPSALNDTNLYTPLEEHKAASDSVKEKDHSKYHREIKPGVWVDVYDVLNAFDPSNRNSADDHAIKKLLLPGKRHQKDGIQDRKEAYQSIARSIELEEAKNEKKNRINVTA